MVYIPILFFSSVIRSNLGQTDESMKTYKNRVKVVKVS